MGEGQRNTPTAEATIDVGPTSGTGDLQGDGLESGAWPAIARSPGDEAHTDMLRAVERGICVILTDVTADDGFRLQWSAWRWGDDLYCHAWHFTPKQGWTRGPSFVVTATSFPKLSKLLSKQHPL